MKHEIKEALYIFGFALLFFVLPKIIIYVIPTNVFYRWDSHIVAMDKQVFESCEPIRWHVRRWSYAQTSAEIVERIIDGSPVKDRDYKVLINNPRHWHDVSVEWDVGCLEPDKYILSGIVQLDILGVKKEYKYRSYEFEVK